MVQQGRLIAAALAGPDGIDVWEAERILLELRQRHQARLRVVDADGRARLGLQPPRPGAPARRRGG